MKVLVFGGTHGNEWTGIMAVTHYADHFKAKYPQLELSFVLANPEAYKINKRFKDEDLNRAYQFLSENRPNSYEHSRAKEIKQLIDLSPCFVIDLHTTTSNMGATVIISHENKKNLFLASKLKENIPDCKIILSPDPQKKYLAGQSDHSLMVEVGPVANGVVSPRALEQTLEVLDTLLGLIENQKDLPTQTLEVEVFEEIQDVTYPLNHEGFISGFIHPTLQDQDFRPLQGSYSAFKTFSGETIQMKTEEELFPIFINEAAYYPTKLAFTLCRKLNKKY